VRLSPSIVLLGIGALFLLSRRGGAAPRKGGKGGGGGGAPRTSPASRSVAFKAGATYALTFDMEPGSPTMAEAELLRAVLGAVESLGMVPASGSPAQGDPAHVRARASSTRTLALPLHFRDVARPVYLLSATPLGPDIHGRRRWR
jgi:hypothetical protein